jgi:cytochrome c5
MRAGVPIGWCAALWIAALIGAPPSSDASPGAAQADADTARAERIINASCLGCHNLRPIETSAYDAAGWQKVIDAEIARGAKLAAADMPFLVEYLALEHGPVPEGNGKAILLNTCTMCHDLKRIRLGRRTADEWEETLNTMLNEGAPLSDEQFAVIHAYLARNFNVQ